MKIFKLLLLTFAVMLLVSMAGYGCAKKQVKTEEGKMEAQQPAPPMEEKKAVPEEEKGKREAAEAPPGPKEQPEAVEAGRPEKALEDIHFDFDKYDIKPSEAAILQKNAGWIKAHPGNVVTIEGHCDERGTVEYNLALGERRAAAAKDYLVSLGINADKLKTLSYGKSKPVDPGHDEEAWAKNRRAHFVVQ